VKELRDDFNFPGMAVLQFAFGSNPTNEFLPHNYTHNQVVYTGTHDNNTTMGWWQEELSGQKKDFARSYLNLSPSQNEDAHWRAIRAVMASVSDRVVFPLQDVIGLGSEGRMNTPGTTEDNWAWRFTPDQISEADEEMLKELTYMYGRASSYD
jgi:4-alpha-glucanotransferase